MRYKFEREWEFLHGNATEIGIKTRQKLIPADALLRHITNVTFDQYDESLD